MELPDCEHWCHVVDDVIHVGEYSKVSGTLSTFTAIDSEVTCSFDSKTYISDLRPWRDRNLLEGMVCQDCTDDLFRQEEQWEASVARGELDDVYDIHE